MPSQILKNEDSKNLQALKNNTKKYLKKYQKVYLFLIRI